MRRAVAVSTQRRLFPVATHRGRWVITTLSRGLLALDKWPDFGSAIIASRADKHGFQIRQPQAPGPAIQVDHDRMPTFGLAAEQLQPARAGIAQLLEGDFLIVGHSRGGSAYAVVAEPTSAAVFIVLRAAPNCLRTGPQFGKAFAKQRGKRN
jgi:hypothetical protein